MQRVRRILYGSALTAVVAACGTSSSSSSGGAPDAAADAASDASGTADAPDAGDDGAAADGPNPNDRVVFVTTDTFAGDFGGSAGADGKCAAAAALSPSLAARTFKAWISSSTSSPAAAFGQIGRFVGTDGTVVANDWTALTSGKLATGIKLDENAKPQSGRVWTGTKTTGAPETAAPVVDTCSDWSSAAATGPTGIAGVVGATDATWTDPTSTPTPTVACSTQLHLYCFQQL
jgi:hypothetical protein